MSTFTACAYRNTANAGCHSCCHESQNHRIVRVGRDLCGSSSPTLLLKQGHLQQAAQDLVRASPFSTRFGNFRFYVVLELYV